MDEWVRRHEVDVLLVAEDASRARLACQALAEGHLECRVESAPTARSAIASLEASLAATAPHRPDIILLDFHLSDGGSRELLAELHWDNRFREIPVIALTQSSSPYEFLEAFDLGARHCICITTGHDRFCNQLNLAIQAYVPRLSSPSRRHVACQRWQPTPQAAYCWPVGSYFVA